MRIENLNIIKYGPIKNKKFDDFKNFNLVYGNNEIGKTLILESLIKMLILKKGKRNNIKNIHRVTENPEGYLYINDGEKKIKYPESGEFLKDYDLTVEDFNNIFLIRDSDLKIKEKKYYVDFTNKLVGLKTEEIKIIKENLQDIGNLTNSYTQLSSTKDNKQLGDRFNMANKYLKKINQEIMYLKKKNYDKLTKRKVEYKKKLKLLKEKLDKLEIAHKRDKYNNAGNLIKELQSIKNELPNYSKIKQDSLDKLKELDNDIKKKKIDIESKKSEINKKNNEIIETSGNLKDVREKLEIKKEDESHYNSLSQRITDFFDNKRKIKKIKKEKEAFETKFREKKKIFKKKKNKYDLIEENKQIFFDLENLFGKKESITEKKEFSFKILIPSLILFLLFAFFSYIDKSTFFRIGGFLFMISFLFSFIYYILNQKEFVKLQKIFDKSKLKLNKYISKNISFENIITIVENIKREFKNFQQQMEKIRIEKDKIENRYEERKNKIEIDEKEILNLKIKLDLVEYDNKQLISKIKKFNKNLNKLDSEYKTLKIRLNSLKKDNESLKKKLIDIEKELQDLKYKKNNLLTSAELKTITEYIDAAKRKNNLNERGKIITTKLNQIFNKDEQFIRKDINNILKGFKTEIRKYEKYKNKAVDVKYSDSEIERIKNDIIECEKKLQELEESSKKYKERMKNIEIKVNNEILINKKEHLFCETITDLEKIKSELEIFVKKIEQKFQNCKIALDIFSEVEKKDRERVTELFGENTQATNIFKQITDNRYKKIIFDKNSTEIKVKSNDGKMLNPSQLSGGTIDQLYISLRLAMGTKMFKNNNGFYLYDDPFIKSDINRLKKQLNILLELSKKGFQFFYFSAKKEVLDHVEKFKNSEIVSIYEL